MASNFKIKNCCKWKWLYIKVSERYLSDCIQNIDRSGHALCIYVNRQINYGGKGKTSVTRHATPSNNKYQDNKKA